MPKKPKARKNADMVDIDGRIQRWEDFTRTFLNSNKAKRGGTATFILKKGNPEREKQLTWNKNTGFVSDDSNDEEVRFARY